MVILNAKSTLHKERMAEHLSIVITICRHDDKKLAFIIHKIIVYIFSSMKCFDTYDAFNIRAMI